MPADRRMPCPDRRGQGGPGGDPARPGPGADRDGLRRDARADRGRPAGGAGAPGRRWRLCGSSPGWSGTLAVITGRPAAEAVELGGFDEVPGLIVLGHYGLERWQDGALTAPAAPPGVAAARERLPRRARGRRRARGGVGRGQGERAGGAHPARGGPGGGAGRAEGAAGAGWPRTRGWWWSRGGWSSSCGRRGWTRGRRSPPLLPNGRPGRCCSPVTTWGTWRPSRAVRALRGDGHPGLTVCSASGEVSELAAEADLVVDGPGGVAALLGWLARSLAPSPRPAP